MFVKRLCSQGVNKLKVFRMGIGGKNNEIEKFIEEID